MTIISMFKKIKEVKQWDLRTWFIYFILFSIDHMLRSNNIYIEDFFKITIKYFEIDIYLLFFMIFVVFIILFILQHFKTKKIEVLEENVVVLEEKIEEVNKTVEKMIDKCDFKFFVCSIVKKQQNIHNIELEVEFEYSSKSRGFYVYISSVNKTIKLYMIENEDLGHIENLIEESVHEIIKKENNYE